MNNKKGFSLIELAVVLGVVSLIMAIAYPSVLKIKENNMERECTEYKNNLEKVIRQYYAFEGEYPSNLDDLRVKEYKIIIDENKYEINYFLDNSEQYTLSVNIK